MVQDEDIGARVRAARSYADLSQGGLAEAIGVERRIVGYIEANESRHELTVPEAQRVSQACGVPVSFLLNGWDASDSLAQRVAELEETVRLAEAERDLLIQRIGRLESELQSRLETYVDEAWMRQQQRAREHRRPGEERRSTP